MNSMCIADQLTGFCMKHFAELLHFYIGTEPKQLN